MLKPLNDALEMYSGAGLEKYDGEDIQGALVDVVSIAGKLREAHSHLLGIFKEVQNRKDREEFELLLADDKIREDFYNQLSIFGKYLAIALESVHLYNALGETEINTFKRDFKYYQELRATVKLRYSDAIDHKEYEAKMRNLMDTYIAAEQVIKITSPVDILDKTDFEKELNKLGSNRAKADAIRTRMTQRIHFKYNENPAYYKKFSERIQEIIDEYKRNRSQMPTTSSTCKRLLKIFVVIQWNNIPRKIKHDGHATFYGVLKDSFPRIYLIVKLVMQMLLLIY